MATGCPLTSRRMGPVFYLIETVCNRATEKLYGVIARHRCTYGFEMFALFGPTPMRALHMSFRAFSLAQGGARRGSVPTVGPSRLRSA